MFFWKTLKDRVPSCMATIAQQSAEVQDKLIDLASRKAGLVSKDDFERQKKVCDRLQKRVEELESEIALLKKQKAEDGLE